MEALVPERKSYNNLRFEDTRPDEGSLSTYFRHLYLINFLPLSLIVE